MTDDANVALFPGASGVFSSFDLTPRAHYEVHGEDEDTSSASNITGQRFSFMRTPATTTSSTAPRTAAGPHRATLSLKHFKCNVGLNRFLNDGDRIYNFKYTYYFLN